MRGGGSSRSPLDHFGGELSDTFAFPSHFRSYTSTGLSRTALGDADVARDHGVVDFAAHELEYIGKDHLVRTNLMARVEPGQHDAVDRKVRVSVVRTLWPRLA